MASLASQRRVASNRGLLDLTHEHGIQHRVVCDEHVRGIGHHLPAREQFTLTRIRELCRGRFLSSFRRASYSCVMAWSWRAASSTLRRSLGPDGGWPGPRVEPVYRPNQSCRP